LVRLGVFAGADNVSGNGGADAAPDATWLFGQRLWVCWEAKTNAEASGELGATSSRQASGHLQYVSGVRGEPAPAGSATFIVSPQTRIHSAARLVADDNVFLLTPDFVAELHSRLVRAWRAVRALKSANPPMNSMLNAFRAEQALPTQWIARAKGSRLQALEDDD
jgi:hypothetical protein